MSNRYTVDNAAELEHLMKLTSRLTDADLSRPADAGWTVAGLLAHLAFWDQRAIVLLRRWKQSGIGPSAMDTDVVNEATRLHCLAIAPRAAVQLAVTSAAAIDNEIEQLDPHFLAAVETDGKTVHLNRAEHRRLHLGDIERLLATKAT